MARSDDYKRGRGGSKKERKEQKTEKETDPTPKDEREVSYEEETYLMSVIGGSANKWKYSQTGNCYLLIHEKGGVSNWNDFERNNNVLFQKLLPEFKLVRAFVGRQGPCDCGDVYDNCIGLHLW